MASVVRGGDASRNSHSVWSTCAQVYGQLALDSGLPGSQVLVEGGGVRRLLWAVALLTLVYYSTTETSAILREYFAYSVTVAFEYNTNESFEMPDVTVCNVNPLRRSKLCALNASERGMNAELEERLCGKRQGFRRANPGDLRLQHYISDWIAQRKATKREWLWALGHQFGDTFVDCTYHDQDCRDDKLFRNVTNAWYGTATASTATAPSGLVLTLNPELDEYLPTSYQAGFIVMVHAHGTRFSVCSDSVYITPGYTTYVGLNLLAQTGLPEPYANPCRSSWPHRMLVHMDHMYGAYTRERAQLQTALGAITGIRDDLVVDVTRASQNPNASMCATRRYNPYQQDARERVQLPPFLQDVVGATKENGPPARLVLYFNSLTYEHIRSVPKYDETHVLGNLGGIIGMYLGLSFFVLFQLLDILVVGTLRLSTMLRWDARERRLVALAPPPARASLPEY
ncbi:acid-sensing ion channel 2 [Dermacentor silvarum]|uniref:acid-sensing ion channel 2 n=1 Tax=Dermacentor silvarum TaxID=543639 RepID=UPI0021008C9A|nr:acid-sensing ion channel 2 [Dermacentor silvarum]